MPSTPGWISDFTEQLAQTVQPFDLLAPLGCHVHHDDATDCWEVTLFAADTETVGGERDGRVASSPFCLDLAGMLNVLFDVEAFYWQNQSAGPGDELGAHVTIEGIFDGRRVRAHILARAPERFPVGRIVNAGEGTIENLW